MLVPAQLTLQELIRNAVTGRTVIAVEPASGIQLLKSGGRSRSGTGHNYILVVYPSCNPRVKAWTDAEAIEIANVKLAKLREKGRVE